MRRYGEPALSVQFVGLLRSAAQKRYSTYKFTACLSGMYLSATIFLDKEADELPAWYRLELYMKHLKSQRIPQQPNVTQAFLLHQQTVRIKH